MTTTKKVIAGVCFIIVFLVLFYSLSYFRGVKPGGTAIITQCAAPDPYGKPSEVMVLCDATSQEVTEAMHRAGHADWSYVAPGEPLTQPLTK